MGLNIKEAIFRSISKHDVSKSNEGHEEDACDKSVSTNSSFPIYCPNSSFLHKPAVKNFHISYKVHVKEWKSDEVYSDSKYFMFKLYLFRMGLVPKSFIAILM